MTELCVTCGKCPPYAERAKRCWACKGKRGVEFQKAWKSKNETPTRLYNAAYWKKNKGKISAQRKERKPREPRGERTLSE